ncbi:MAG: hypothetical protein NTX45_12525 [Proteobacteria bacterium]|nr:hypothetical protein [Pseudomonadota bacterium]
MLYLFDTSALLAHYRREAGWQQVQAIFDDATTDILLASLTLTEFARRLRELGAIRCRSSPNCRGLPVARQ